MKYGFISSEAFMILVAGCWVLGIGYWVLVTGYWVLVTGYWVPVTGYWLLIADHWSLNIRAVENNCKSFKVGTAAGIDLTA